MNLDFEKYLESTGISAKSIKNYKSDISQFFTWAKTKLKELGAYVEDLSEMSPFLSREFVSQYLDHMHEIKLPRKTLNRRLSTLRHLSKFLTASQVVDSDFMDGVSNISDSQTFTQGGVSVHPSVNEFRAFLEAEKISKNTVKNYLSDVRQFLTWLENNHARFT